MYVDEVSFDNLPEPSDAEGDMLDMAFHPQPNSRLGCLVQLTKEHDKTLSVEMPTATRNMAVDGYVATPH